MSDPNHFFDDVIYPEGLEAYHFKSAITKRNRYMVDNATVAICYVKYSWGSAVQTFSYAKKCGLEIYNLADYED